MCFVLLQKLFFDFAIKGSASLAFILIATSIQQICATTDCSERRVRITLITGEEDGAGTKNTVYVKFFKNGSEYAEKITPLNDDKLSGAYRQEFRQGQHNSFVIVLRDYNNINFSSIEVGFSDYTIKDKNILDDDWMLMRIWIQTGDSDYYFIVNEWITKEREMVKFSQIKENWPANCPADSDTVDGVPDKCFKYIQMEKGFKEAIDYCKINFDGKGSLLSLKPQNYITRVAEHFQIKAGALLWLRFAKMEYRTGDLQLEEPYWADDQSYEKILYEDIEWYPGEPMGRKNEWCGCFKGSSGHRVHDCNCGHKHQFICEISDPSILIEEFEECTVY